MSDHVPLYSFRVIKTGENTGATSGIYCGEGYDQWEEFCYTMSLIQGPDKTIVINTGFAEDPSDLFQLWLNVSPKCRASRSEEQKPKDALIKLGVDPTEVDILILSPLVAYATGNIDLFPNAQICILRSGWQDFFAPEPNLLQLPRHICFPDDQFQYLLNQGWDRIRLLDDEDEVLPGIKTFFAGVHHRTSLAICVNTNKGKVIQSDSFFKYGNIEKMKPIGVAESMFEAARTYRRIQKEADIIVPPFDPEVFRRHQDGIVA